MANDRGTVLYTGMTCDLPKRVYEHKTNAVDGFTKKYRTHKLVYYEVAADRYLALMRERQIKHYRHEKKAVLIPGMNPEWKDLYEQL